MRQMNTVLVRKTGLSAPCFAAYSFMQKDAHPMALLSAGRLTVPGHAADQQTRVIFGVTMQWCRVGSTAAFPGDADGLREAVMLPMQKPQPFSQGKAVGLEIK